MLHSDAMDIGGNKDMKLSPEVEPFIPQKRVLEPSLGVMGLPSEAGGGGGATTDAPPIPTYLITCYPFVQENQPNRHFPLYSDSRWPQPTASSSSPYMAYHLVSPPQPTVPSDYGYYHIVPASCPPMLGFYPPFPSGYGAFQTGAVSTALTDCGDPPLAPGQVTTNHRAKSIFWASPLHKGQQTCQLQRVKRQPARSMVVHRGAGSVVSEGRLRPVLLVDACQQTDSQAGSDAGSLVSWKNQTRWRRPYHWVTETSSGQGTNEAGSDSGYCSPKHSQVAGVSQNAALVVDTGVVTATGWSGAASQGPHKSWADRSGVYHREGRAWSEPRGYAQKDIQGAQLGRGGSILMDRGCGPGPQKRLQEGASPPGALLSGAEPSTETLHFEDDEEFPELTPDGGSAHGSSEPTQSKMPQNLLDGLPEGSPISIVKTPIPITTSVPKRAKSQRKKALAAALATAQEYSEISMEQKKLQETLSKATVKKSKTAVQLDLGDMLAALEKHQQAMKARQLTNTKPLTYTVGTMTGLPFSASNGKIPGPNRQAFTTHLNILDSSAPRVKRGKERETPKPRRPTALKKVILKEREVKMGKLSLDPTLAPSEQSEDAELPFSDALTQEAVVPDEHSLSMPSDPSLSPASQNSPYSITPISQGSPASSGIGSPLAASAITKIHSRRFREYCNQVLNKAIDESVMLLLQELVRFQERVYQREPSKAKAKRRLVMGLREVTKHMKLLKIKCVIISPNCEKIQSKGGLDEALYNVIAMAREQSIPFVFALGRKALGRCVNKLVPVSVVGIFNFSGAEDLFYRLVSLTEEARMAYRDMVSALEQEQADEALRSVRKVPHHMGHSRNPSAASAISFCSVISEPISEVNEQEYETNWRNMVETSDGLEAAEGDTNREPCGRVARSTGQPIGTATVPIQPRSMGSIGPGAEREEGRPDDSLEWASQRSQHSTETGSLDGSGRDPRTSSITSTASTLVPGMLEEGEEEEEDEEEDEEYAPEPVSLKVPALSSRIESWVSETLENMQLRESQNSSEEEEEDEEEGRTSDDEDLDSELIEPDLDHKKQQVDTKNTPL